ncbi:MAG TPA: hypothetical protein VFB13_15175 [Reyranella sp.]|jgi:MFS family permease|nr:hypothetical protein [Reyranella sp.]
MSDAGSPSASAAAFGDPHAPARNNIRETMKWMATAFAAVAAAIVGSSPLTGLGTPMPEWRLELAIGSGLLGLLLLGVGIRIALSVLVTPPLFLREVPKDAKLLKLINDNAEDFLPPPYIDLAAFVQARERGTKDVRENNSNAPTSLAFLKTSGRWVGPILGYAYLELLRRRLEVATRWLFIVGFFAAVSLAVFAWAANPGGKREIGKESHSRIEAAVLRAA